MSAAPLAEQASVRALLAAFEQLGGEASPGELGEAAGLAASTRSKWLARMREAGYVAGPEPRPHLTTEGWAAAGAPASPPGASLELGQAISRWPTEQHRAFLRLALSAVVARWHLGGRRGEGHPGFIVGGATGTGKTQLARFVSEALGLDWALTRMLLADRTPGEVLGRTERSEGGTWTFRPAPLIAAPFLVFDEFDKAERALQRDALLCFQGDVRVAREGSPFDLRAVPMLTCNKARQLPVPDEYRRRSVVLDTDPLTGLLADLDLRLRELYAEGGPPRLELDTTVPPAAQLPADAFGLLRETLRRSLTDAGWQLCSAEAVELMALGAAAGTPGADLGVQALHTAVDYLTCAETVGETRDGWRAGVAGALHELGAGAALADVQAALERGAGERRQLDATRRRAIAERSEESLALTGARQTFAEQLRLARPDTRTLPEHERPRAKGLRAQLDRLREQVLNARTADALDELQALAAGPLRAVEQLRVEREREREREAAAAAEAKRQRDIDATRRRETKLADDRRRQAAAAARQDEQRRMRARRAEAAGELTAVRAEAVELERLWRRERTSRDESPLAALRALEVLVFQPADAGSANEGRVMRAVSALAAAGGQGYWRSPHDPLLSFYGTRSRCDALAQWGPATRSAIEAALRPLHALEDELQARAGRKPRSARPRLTAPGPATLQPAGHLSPRRL